MGRVENVKFWLKPFGSIVYYPDKDSAVFDQWEEINAEEAERLARVMRLFEDKIKPRLKDIVHMIDEAWGDDNG